jgi:site-specific recombinase XerD
MSPVGAQPPRLLDQVRLTVRARLLSPRTEEAYAGWVRRFVRFHGMRHPRAMGEAEVSAFLMDLTGGRQAAASTHNQALSALLFLYREVLGAGPTWGRALTPAAVGVRIPVVLTRQEVSAVLGRLTDPSRLVCELLYGAGLRLLETTHLLESGYDIRTIQEPRQVTAQYSISRRRLSPRRPASTATSGRSLRRSSTCSSCRGLR